MNEFEKFLEENNYEDDLEFQLCDLEVAFNAGKELHWKPSEEQLDVLLSEANAWIKGSYKQIVLESLYNDLKKLKESKL